MPEVLSASLEDYLKAIFHIAEVKQAARAKDISARMGVSNSSVTGALRTLADRGLVNYAPYDLITLTRLGQAAARDVVRRHEALREFFVKVLAVDSETAELGACKMEHEIPPAIVERFIQFVDFVEVCPRAGAEWLHGFGYSCPDVSREGCAHCVRTCLAAIEDKQEQPGKAKTILSHLKIGQRAKLIRIGGKGELHKRLVEMGLVAGAVLGVERVAPLGDPIEIKLRGYHLSLRKEEAALITVEALETVGEPGVA